MVLSPDFIEKLEEIVIVARPFVHWSVAPSFSRTYRIGLTVFDDSLNDMMTIQDPDGDPSEGDDDNGDTEEEDDDI